MTPRSILRVLVLCAALPAVAFAGAENVPTPPLASVKFHALLPKPEADSIPGFRVDSVEKSGQPQGGFVRLIVRGRASPEIRSLVLMQPFVQEDIRVPFEITVPVSLLGADLEFASISASGKVFRQKVALRADEPSIPRHFTFTPGLGLSRVSYKQSGLTPVSVTAITAKAALDYPLVPEKWIVGLSVYITALPIQTSPSGLRFRFIGANFRAGPLIRLGNGKWRLSALAGYYYATTVGKSSADGVFGYRLNGPQIFPVLKYDLASGAAIYGYLKFASTIAQLENREVATGGGYLFRPNAKGAVWGINLDIAALHAALADRKVDSLSMSLGASRSF